MALSPLEEIPKVYKVRHEGYRNGGVEVDTPSPEAKQAKYNRVGNGVRTKVLKTPIMEQSSNRNLCIPRSIFDIFDKMTKEFQPPTIFLINFFFLENDYLPPNIRTLFGKYPTSKKC